jgi:hypothetical protein
MRTPNWRQALINEYATRIAAATSDAERQLLAGELVQRLSAGTALPPPVVLPPPDQNIAEIS